MKGRFVKRSEDVVLNGGLLDQLTGAGVAVEERGGGEEGEGEGGEGEASAQEAHAQEASSHADSAAVVTAESSADSSPVPAVDEMEEETADEVEAEKKVLRSKRMRRHSVAF